jgi:hypothetical protein
MRHDDAGPIERVWVYSDELRVESAEALRGA